MSGSSAGDGRVTISEVSDLEAFVGKRYPEFAVVVDAARMAQFSDSIGDGSPLRSDRDAARAAGYRDCVAPPTFLFSLTLAAGQSFNVLDDMGIPHTQAVHGAQSFHYVEPVCAGDRLTGEQKITNVFSKKGGALIFVNIETPIYGSEGQQVATLGSTIVIRNG